MSKFVLLNIDEGSFEQGFRIRLGIGEDGPTYYREQFTLLPAPDIPHLYNDWQNKYRDLGKTIRQINVPSAQVTHCSVIEDENLARIRFEKYLLDWLAQLSWRELRVKIEERTQPHELIRVIIDTNNIYLKKLPWHLWELFHNRPHAEFALSGEYAPPTEPLKCPVKILAIFGGSEGLNLNSDRELITKLSRRGAKITWLEQPHRSELSENLWNQHWDILFFAGHSSSGEKCKTGEIQINDSESISLTRFRNSLRSAVKKGLKLAIFNSCDGLGLADELIGVKVPQMIVMREPVPDEVARQFLKYFLEDFSQGHSLYLAVRNARQRLEWMEDHFPCASWLPVICQNPAAPPLIWKKSSISIQKTVTLTGILATVIFGLFLGFKIPNINSENSPSNPQQEEKVQPESTTKLDYYVDNFSWGEKILIDDNSTSEKQAGVNAFRNQKFSQAIQNFKKSLNQKPNDPETLIYLNNAIAEEIYQINSLPVLKSLKNCIQPNNTTNDKTLKIAVPVPIGSDSHIAKEILLGVAQAQNKINCQGGINGRLLQVLIVDDRDDKQLVKDLAEQILGIKEILAVLGHHSSSSTLVASQVYDKNIVAISATSNASREINNSKELNFSDWIFRTYPSVIKDLVEYVVDTKKIKKVAIVYLPNRKWSESTSREFEKSLKSKGGKIVYKCELNSVFLAQNCLETAIKKGAKAMLLLPESKGNNYYRALQILNANYNNDKKIFLLSATLMHKDIILQQKQLAENLVSSTYWYEDEKKPSKFGIDAKALWNLNEKIGERTVTSYDATMALIEGLRLMGDNPTRRKLKQILSAPNFSASGATGKVEFDKYGDRKITDQNDAQIGVLVQVKCGTPVSQPNCKFVRVSQQ